MFSFFSSRRGLRAAFLSVTLHLCFSSRVHAIETGPVSIHGAISATASYSDRYDYLGNTAENPHLNLVETILNGNYLVPGGPRLSAQLYSYKVGDYTAITMDFASLDYSFSREFGVRVGRVRHGLGLFGESQDLDMIRPFAYLPLDFYSKSERSFSASIDGAQFYGNVGLGSGSSIDYQIYAGWIPKLDPSAPLLATSGESSPFVITNGPKIPIYGTWLAWNTPIAGLRLSTSVVFLTSTAFNGPVRSASSLALATSDARLLPTQFPPGLWDLLVAGKTAYLEGDAHLLYFSADYTRNNWQFSAEARFLDNTTLTSVPVVGPLPNSIKSDSYYAMATWQAAPKLQFGAYYSLGYADRRERDGRNLRSLPAHLNWLKDFAFATSYNLAPWWLIKGEIHLVNGTKGVRALGNGDAATWSPHWNYLAVKTTITF